MMIDYDAMFIEALRNKDRATIARVPKSDLHNHVPYGGSRTFLEMIEGRTIPKCDHKFCTIPEMNAWCKNNIKIKNDYQLRVFAGYFQAWQDGIKVFAPNFAFCAQKEFASFMKYIDFIKRLGDMFGGYMHIYPELCLDRNKCGEEMEGVTKKFLDTGIFKSIDLVGDEFIGVDSFVGCYKIAKEYGIIRKAHVGEFADSSYVIDSINKLDLNCIQHGIALAKDEDAMRIAKEKNITLTICPSSNLMLSRMKSMKEHPVVKLYRHGLNISIGSAHSLYGCFLTNIIKYARIQIIMGFP